MPIKPEAGMVLRYDYLWKSEDNAGHIDGKKDRPCVIVIASPLKEDKSREVVVCPITHSQPHKKDSAVEIPYKVSQHLNLDHERMWIKTHEVNKFKWEAGITPPCGVTPISRKEWAYGMMPKQLSKQAFEQVKENSRERSLGIVNRDKVKNSKSLIKDFVKDENGSQPRKTLENNNPKSIDLDKFGSNARANTDKKAEKKPDRRGQPIDLEALQEKGKQQKDAEKNRPRDEEHERFKSDDRENEH